jgi:hypothetical protein
MADAGRVWQHAVRVPNLIAGVKHVISTGYHARQCSQCTYSAGVLHVFKKLRTGAHTHVGLYPMNVVFFLGGGVHVELVF